MVIIQRDRFTRPDLVWKYQVMRDYFEWVKEAACNGAENPNAFGKPKDDYEVRQAKRVCEFHCPVRDDCLMHGIIYGETGVWGGFSEHERDEKFKGIRGKLMEIAIHEGVFRRKHMARPYVLSDDIDDSPKDSKNSKDRAA
jgi:hypothetical protein